MYRYLADNSIVYASEDIVLFRESPFASWMERLTLENPDHGIPPDTSSPPPADAIQRQDELAEILRVEHKDVELVDWEASEQERRTATLGAMRRGVDFIVNGHLAVGPLSGPANLLMRTSGYSELGNYLYMPCDTQPKTTLNSAFRLCFLADLLHSIQGQLPPHMLLIRGGSDILPLRTEDHIYHYRAVKQRFMLAMREFRKHRMPDPAESAHFGRWADCANEVLRQRALRAAGEEVEETLPLEQLSDEAVFAEADRELDALQAMAAPRHSARVFASDPRIGSRGIQVSDTLAAQALRLEPGVAAAPDDVYETETESEELHLERLDFIGAGMDLPGFDIDDALASDTDIEEEGISPLDGRAFAAPLSETITETITQTHDSDPHVQVDAEADAVFEAPDPVESPGTETPAHDPFVQGSPSGAWTAPLPSLNGFAPADDAISAAATRVPSAFAADEVAHLEGRVADVDAEVDDGGIDDAPCPAPELAVPAAPRRPHPLDSRELESEDLPDEQPEAEWSDYSADDSPGVQLRTDSGEFEVDCIDDSDYQLPEDCRTPVVNVDEEAQVAVEVQEISRARALRNGIGRLFGSGLVTGPGSDTGDHPDPARD
ncbi:hypothetical protein E4634_19325 [Mangrovimicrobium sediminis]|uniref:Uncharacterized protein n=1 Tax=Mangrovimicrobium sediminis TaxID=2562682 RepID=A0A4Z0LVJ7_9GAMM|nr:hypothetical protein [Haliea sp. SAOS-164]TGD71423.1 hypothetical protein E4634_19325 [Haliea sp. SAOS-164]